MTPFHIEPRCQQRQLKVTMNPKLLEILVCPVCKSQLTYRKDAGELLCSACRLAYPVRDDIPVMLPEQARPLETDELVS